MEEEFEQALPIEEAPEQERPSGQNLTGQERFECIKCHKVKSLKKEFFTRRDGTKEPMCKDCLTMFINNRDRESFEWILEKFDVPYVHDEWVRIYNAEVEKKGRVSSNGVLGKYLRSMSLQQWNKFTYADTEKLNFQNEKDKAAQAARMAESNPEASEKLLTLQQQLDAGEITQAQFDTENPLNILENQITEFREFSPTVEAEEDEVMKSLSDEEIQMLKLKWGRNYRPSQWIYLEDLYTQYENEFELSTDRIVILKQICKISLEMNECLEMKDFKSYRDLSNTFDALRKSGKFTESQKSEESTRYLDSIGELVAFVEREGGIIENLPNPDETPIDNVDYAIKNMKAYYYDVVTNELGLGNMIEAYIKRLEQAQSEEEIDMEGNLITSASELEQREQEYARAANEYAEYLEYGIEDEIAAILEGGEL